MTPLLKEIRGNPLLWLLMSVPMVFVAQKLRPDARTMLFGLSVLFDRASRHAPEPRHGIGATKTGDAVGDMLSAEAARAPEKSDSTTERHAEIVPMAWGEPADGLLCEVVRSRAIRSSGGCET